MKRGRALLACVIACGAWLLPACNGDCVAPPCMLPFAMTVTVTSSASGAPVYDAVLQVAGETDPRPCPGNCFVQGYAGTYSITVSAPGFKNVQRTVVVSGTPAARCGCSGVTTTPVAISMPPVAP